jgi:hypothetical protein
MKFLIKNLQVFNLIITFIMSATIVANELPDEIDHQYFFKLYQNTKNNSDNKRNATIQQLKQVQNTKSRVSKSLNEIIHLNSQITWAEEKATTLYLDNQNLQNLINNKDRQNRNLNHEVVKGNNQKKSNIRKTEKNRSQLLSEEKELQEIKINVGEAGDKIERIKTRRNKKKKESSDLLNILYVEKEKLRKKNKKRSGLANEISETKNNVIRLDKKISQARTRFTIKEVNHYKNRSFLGHLKSQLPPFIQRKRMLSKKHEKLNTEISSIRSAIQKTNNELVIFKNKLNAKISSRNKVKRSNKENHFKIGLLKDVITRATNNIRNLKVELSKINSDLAQQRTKAVKLTTRREKIVSQIIKLQLLTQTDEISEKSLKLKIKKKRLVNILLQVRIKIKKSMEEKGKKKKEMASNEIKVSDAEQQIPVFEQDIQDALKEIAATNQQIVNVKSTVDFSEIAVNQLETNLSSLRNGKKSLISKSLQLKSLIISKKNKISLIQKMIQKLQNAMAKIKEKIDLKIVKVQDTKKGIPFLQDRMTKTDEKITKLKLKISTMNNELQVKQIELSRIRYRLDDAKSSLNKISIRLNKQRTIGDKLFDQITMYDKQRVILADQTFSKDKMISNNTKDISNARSTIANNLSSIATEQTKISNFKSLIVAREKNRLALNKNLSNDLKAFKDADLLAKASDSTTALAYMEFKKRKKRFKKYLSEATLTGETQGKTLGAQVGYNDGEKNVNLTARKIGQKIGLEIALLESGYRGLIRGKLIGHQEGYHAGINSKFDVEVDKQEGVIIGKRLATELALKEDYPLGYQEKREQLLLDIPGKPIALDNNETRVISNLKGLKTKIKAVSLIELTEDETIISQEDLELASNIDSSIDETIILILQKLQDYNTPERDLSLPQLVYKNPKEVPTQAYSADCSNLHNDRQVFIKACQVSFINSFKSSYLKSFKKTFFELYSILYNGEKEISFTEHKNDDYELGKQTSYSIVFDEGKIEGAAISNNRSLLEGQEFGFDDSIEEQRARALLQGEEDVISFFKRNGVLRTRSRDSIFINPKNVKGLIQGSLATLGLKLANTGDKDTNFGEVSVKFEALTSNITLNKESAVFRILPARTSIDLTNITSISIRNDAIPGSQIKIKAIISYPGDDITSSFMEERIIEANVKFNSEI